MVESRLHRLRPDGPLKALHEVVADPLDLSVEDAFHRLDLLLFRDDVLLWSRVAVFWLSWDLRDDVSQWLDLAPHTDRTKRQTVTGLKVVNTSLYAKTNYLSSLTLWCTRTKGSHTRLLFPLTCSSRVLTRRSG